MKKKNSINLVFYLITLILSLVITSFISAEALGVINTVDTFVFPNSFIKKDFNSTRPWIEYSYLIKNNHYVILSRVSITVEIDVSYQTQNESLLRQSIFKSSETFHDIQPGSVLHKSNNYSSSYFLLDNLNDLWLNINTTKPYSSLITVHLTGNYVGNFAKFSLIFRDLNLSLYEYPF